MEHRYSTRQSANVKILIYKSGLPMAVGWLRNISRQGLYISSEYDNIAINQLLEIEVLGSRGEKCSHKKCRALVAHKTADGFGVALDDERMGSCEMMENLLAKCRLRHAAFAALNDGAETPVKVVMSK